MTTIAYHDGIIAVDSQVSASSMITDIDKNKIVKRGGIVFVCWGACADEADFIAAYNGDDYNKKADVGGIVDDHGIVYIAAIDNEEDGEGFWKQDITGRYYATGSGAAHAWTALDLGCTAVEAVKMAIKRNIYTGGRVRTHKVMKKR